MTDQKNDMRSIPCPLAKTYRKAAGLTHFLKGYYDGSSAVPLEGQESYRMRFFAVANCLIKIDEEVTECKEGEAVKYIFFTPIKLNNGNSFYFISSYSLLLSCIHQ